LPHLPRAAIGLVNLRGDVVLTFDLGQMLNLRKDIAAHPNQRLVLLKDDSDELGQRSAFLVDEIVSVIEINEADLQSLRDADQDDSGSYIDAVIESGTGESISRISPRALLNGVKRMLL
jgi:chemotaxis signal transduction protein